MLLMKQIHVCNWLPSFCKRELWRYVTWIKDDTNPVVILIELRHRWIYFESIGKYLIDLNSLDTVFSQYSYSNARKMQLLKLRSTKHIECPSKIFNITLPTFEIPEVIILYFYQLISFPFITERARSRPNATHAIRKIQKTYKIVVGK